jgi:hypothetical protein
MCYDVEPEYVLASMFRSGKFNSISYKNLYDVKLKVKENLHSSVHLELTKDALCSAVELYPKMFEWKDDMIVQTEDSSKYFDERSIETIFGWAIDETIKTELNSVIHQI